MEGIAHWDQVEPLDLRRGPMQLDRFDLGQAAGSVGIGVARLKLDPGGRSSPVHVELDEEAIRQVDGFKELWEKALRAFGPPPWIFVRQDLAPDGQRTTLAHEYGHFLFHTHPAKLRADYLPADEPILTRDDALDALEQETEERVLLTDGEPNEGEIREKFRRDFEYFTSATEEYAFLQGLLRFRSFFGAAHAAEMTGDREKAKAFYAKLVALADQADRQHTHGNRAAAARERLARRQEAAWPSIRRR